MSQHKRCLSSDEQQRLNVVLRNLAFSPTVEQQLKDLVLFIEGDISVSHPVVKQTAAITQLIAVIDRAPSSSAIALALRIFELLSAETQSQKVLQPFLRTERLRALLRLLDDPEILPPLAGLLEQLFSSVDSDVARTVASNVELPAKVVDALKSRVSVDQDEGLICHLCRIFVTMCGWQKRKQDEVLFAVPLLMVGIENQVRSEHWTAATALLHCMGLLIAENESNASAAFSDGHRSALLTLSSALVSGIPPLEFCAEALAFFYTSFASAQSTEDMMRRLISSASRDSERGSATSVAASSNGSSAGFVAASLDPQVVGAHGCSHLLWSPACHQFRQFVALTPQWLTTIRREHLKTEVVGATLNQMHDAVKSAANDQMPLYRAVLSSFNAVKTLLLPLASVDEELQVLSCTLLAFVIQGSQNATRLFVALGGMSIMVDVMDDYSDEVLRAAVILLGTLLSSPFAFHDEIEKGIVARIVKVLHRTMNRIVRLCGEGTSVVATKEDEEPESNSGLHPALMKLLAALLFYFSAFPPSEFVTTLSSSCVDMLQSSFQKMLFDPQVGATNSSNALFPIIGNIVRSYQNSLKSIFSRIQPSDEFTMLLQGIQEEASVRLIGWVALIEGGELQDEDSITELCSAVVALLWLCVTTMQLDVSDSTRQQSVCVGQKPLSLSQMCIILVSSFRQSNLRTTCWETLAQATSNCEYSQIYLAADTHLTAVIAAALQRSRDTLDSLHRDPFLQQAYLEELHHVLQVAAHVFSRIYIDPASQEQVIDFESHPLHWSDFVARVSNIASHPLSTIPVRNAAINALQCALSWESARERFPLSIAHHLFQILILCEESELEECTMLGNRAFKLMLLTPKHTITTMFLIANDALTLLTGSEQSLDGSPFRDRNPSSATTSPTWRWNPIEPILDVDDAHDLLILTLPLINGLLHHDQSCCDVLFSLSNGMGWRFFQTLLATKQLELGVKALAIFALGNLLNHCQSASDAQPLLGASLELSHELADFLEISNKFLPLDLNTTSQQFLSQYGSSAHVQVYPQRSRPSSALDDFAILEAAGRGIPTLAALTDAKDILYFVCERLVLLCRLTHQPHFTLPCLFEQHQGAAADGNVVSSSPLILCNVCADVTLVSNAASLLLCWLQDDADVAALSRFDLFVAERCTTRGAAAESSPIRLHHVVAEALNALCKHPQSEIRMQAQAHLRRFE